MSGPASDPVRDRHDATFRILGVFPGPAAWLLLPAAGEGGEGDREHLSHLVAGLLDPDLPPGWCFVAAAARGDLAGALRELGTADDEISTYNRFVLAPGAEELDDVAARLGEDLRALVHAAAWAAGLDTEPAPRTEGPPELCSALDLVAASRSLERGDPEDARRLLGRAADRLAGRSAIFRGHLLAQLADLAGDDASAAMAFLDQAVAGLPEHRPAPVLASVVGDWCFRLGVLRHQLSGGRRQPLLAAIEAYQAALRQGVDAALDPELFGLIQNNLGLAYVALPMGEAGGRLQGAVAVQAFREALTVYDRDERTEAWASVQLNLANALQYLHSSHPAENLAQAAAIYEQVAAVRNAALDPVGYARLLANHGNALAHLGRFSEALDKLREADELFRRHGLERLADNVREQVSAIHERVGEGRAAAGEDAASDPPVEAVHSNSNP